jgi:hypothetical protein
MLVRVVATLVIMVCILGFCIVLLSFGNDVQTAVVWSGVAGAVSAEVAARLLTGTSPSTSNHDEID